MNVSQAALLASLPQEQQSVVLADLSDDELRGLEYDWRFWARPNQLEPEGLWRVWLLLAGRGFGKSRTGAEWVRSKIQRGCSRIALLAATASDVRDVVVEGESGLLACCWEDDRDHRGNLIGKPIYEPSKRRLTWANGAIATTYTADEPDRLRGPQHDAAWCDELAAWRYPEAWDMLMFGLRLGDDPRAVVTTTPKPVKLVRDLLRDPTTVVTRGSTFENRGNLAQAFLDQIVTKYQGTRLGRQELNAEVLDDVPGALWRRDDIDRDRRSKAPTLRRIVVAIDPAVTSGEEADETGIVVAGLGSDGHGYVLDDLSGRYLPIEWARKAIAAYKEHKADRIVAEINNGGEMVEATIRMVDQFASYKPVHASRGKAIRAEPVSALYEQGRVHHVGSFPELEDQMCNFAPDFDRKTAGYSPDRMDALVWALSELMVDGRMPIHVPGDALARASIPARGRR